MLTIPITGLQSSLINGKHKVAYETSIFVVVVNYFSMIILGVNITCTPAAPYRTVNHSDLMSHMMTNGSRFIRLDRITIRSRTFKHFLESCFILLLRILFYFLILFVKKFNKVSTCQYIHLLWVLVMQFNCNY